MKIAKIVSKTVKAIKQEARTYQPAAIGYDALLEHGPISNWVDSHCSVDIEKFTEEEYWSVVDRVEDRLENWRCSDDA
jgi:hypothetical protein